MFTIGVLARKAGCSLATVRFYEQTGLMPKAERREGGHRVYGRPDLARLMLIRRCRDLDLPLDRIKVLLDLQSGGKACGDTLEFFKEQRKAIARRVDTLRDLDLTLSLYIDNCESGCGARDGVCDIYEALGA